MSMSTINDYIDSFKQEIDNDSIVYLFDSGFAFAMSRELLSKKMPAAYNPSEVFNYYDDILKPAIGSGELRNILYKNNDGIWVKIFPLINDYKNVTEIFNLANDSEIYQNYIAKKSLLPELIYTDKNKKMHKIYARDNIKSFTKKESIYIDEMDPNQIKIEQYSIENPSYGFSMRHVMNDLKITFLNETPENILVNLNGVFVEPIKSTDPNVIYIKNARYVYKTNNDIIGEDTELLESSTSKLFDASLELSPDSKFLKHYSINLRIFKWDNVVIEPWLYVKHIDYFMKAYEYKNVRIISSLTFNDEINKDSCLVICNGQIMDPSEYKIEGKKLHLLNIEQDFDMLYRELKSKGVVFALTEASNFINSRYYFIINIKDKDEANNHLVLKRSTPIDINLMGYGSVLFENVHSQDLITVDGSFLPYYINDNGLMYFPKFSNDTLFDEEDLLPFTERKITKYELVNYYEPVS